MIDTKLRKTFLQKHSANCSPEECYLLFRHYFTRYNYGRESPEVQSLGNCLGYLKKLVSTHKPEACIRIIYAIEGWDFEIASVELEYAYLIYTIALIEYHYLDYQSCAHWAKKTLSLVGYFHPLLNQKGREETIQQNTYYACCQKLWDECETHYDSEVDKLFILDWERKFYFPKVHGNENCEHE